MKKILVPIDFSELTDIAIDFATGLAKNALAEVEIVHFMDFPLDVELKVSGDSQLEESSENDLYNLQLIRANQKKIADLNTKYQDAQYKVTAEVHGGGFLKGIQHKVENNEIDLVVMGTSGEESIQELFSGNHAEQLIEHLDIPIITLREKVDVKSINHIVLGLDLKDNPYQPWMMLSRTKRILDCFNAKVYLVDVVPYNTAYKEELRLKLGNIAEELKLENYEVDVIEHRNNFTGLVQFADKIDARMIGSFTNSRPGIHRLFRRSFAEDLTKVSDMPVLVLNKRNVAKMNLM